jgi:recombination protein RecA
MAKAKTEKPKNAIDKIYAAIGESDMNQAVKDYLTTGIYPLNKIISGDFLKGLPVGRITEIYGGESSGKTLMATMAMIEAQRKKGLAVMLDYEHAFDVNRAMSLGLDVSRENWIYKQPDTAEKGFEIIETVANLVRTEFPEKYVCVVTDSVASMPTKAENDAGFDGGNMKTKLSLAACMSANLKLLVPIINKTNITMVFLNQTRENPGVMFGDKTKTAGGNALKFYASVRIKLSKGAKQSINGDAKPGEEVIGEKVKAQTVKNKVAPPFREAEYISDFSMGVNLILTHIEYLESAGFFGSTAGWLEYAGKKYRKKELAKKCQDDSGLYQEIMNTGFNRKEAR